MFAAARKVFLFQLLARFLLVLGCLGYSVVLPAADSGVSSQRVLLGQKLTTNKQYCFYQRTKDGYQLLTPHSLARSDIVAAAQSESVSMSKALNSFAYAFFPAGVACGGSVLLWLGIGKRFGYVTLLSCSLLTALIVRANLALAEGNSHLQQAIDQLLVAEQQPSEYPAELFRVLLWLESDNAIACPRQPSS